MSGPVRAGHRQVLVVQEQNPLARLGVREAHAAGKAREFIDDAADDLALGELAIGEREQRREFGPGQS
jgi:hypothetical protein